MGGVGGGDGLDGAFLLQCEQRSRASLISDIIPGQNTDDSALVIMPLVPWWEAWSVDRTFDLRDGGTSTRSLYKITPSTEFRRSRN